MIVKFGLQPTILIGVVGFFFFTIFGILNQVGCFRVEQFNLIEYKNKWTIRGDELKNVSVKDETGKNSSTTETKRMRVESGWSLLKNI